MHIVYIQYSRSQLQLRCNLHSPASALLALVQSGVWFITHARGTHAKLSDDFQQVILGMIMDVSLAYHGMDHHFTERLRTLSLRQHSVLGFGKVPKTQNFICFHYLQVQKNRKTQCNLYWCYSSRISITISHSTINYHLVCFALIQ